MTRHVPAAGKAIGGRAVPVLVEDRTHHSESGILGEFRNEKFKMTFGERDIRIEVSDDVEAQALYRS
jgi:hypothetical protein